MLHLALILLCTAQILHFARHWYALSVRLYAAHSDQRLKSHLDWSRHDAMAVFGDPRPGSALNRHG